MSKFWIKSCTVRKWTTTTTRYRRWGILSGSPDGGYRVSACALDSRMTRARARARWERMMDATRKATRDPGFACSS